jgi:NitT/TauT family transport system substrate-binding protein
MFRDQPEAVATKIEEWSGVEREVVYMFLGPSGLQQLNPTISQLSVEALKNSVVTLKQLGKLDGSVNPEEVTQWTDDSYLRQAMQEMGLNYDEVAKADGLAIAGKDAQTQQPIEDPKMAAQIWIKGEDKVMNFASIENMMAMLQKLKTEGNKAVGAIFVHDRNHGWKLFAENSFYVRKGKEVSAFLTAQEAQTFAQESGTVVADFKGLQQTLAQTTHLAVLVGSK